MNKTIKCFGLLALIGVMITGVAQAENLLKNHSFETGTKGWKGQISVEGKVVKSPQFVIHIDDDGALDSKGCLKVLFEVPKSHKWWSHSTGVIVRTNTNILPNTKVIISFYAKRLSGSPVLSIMRLGGGSNTDVVELLGKKWRQYSVEIQSVYKTSEYIFSLVGNPNKKTGFQRIKSGSFLLDNVIIETIKE